MHALEIWNLLREASTGIHWAHNIHLLANDAIGQGYVVIVLKYKIINKHWKNN